MLLKGRGGKRITLPTGRDAVKSFHSTCAPPARCAGALMGGRQTDRSGWGWRAQVCAALLFVALHVGLAASTVLAAEDAPKNGDSVRVTADQMHQLNVVKVELYPFRVQKLAIGQIAYNEDTSTAVLAPFSGRVTGLVAKIGDQVKRGDPLFEIDSPEVVQPQNDFIAAVAALNKARSQLDLAQIVEKRLKDL